MSKPYAASYECGRQLIASGCPLDFLNCLPRRSSQQRKHLYLRELGGNFESRVLDLGLQTGYIVPLIVGTDLPAGIIISDWSFVAAWGHHISWDYDGFDMVPPNRENSYARLLESRLPAVLNERRLIARGRPVEGLLCGKAFQPIPEGIDVCKPVEATLTLTDDTGRTTSLRFRLCVDRSMAPKQAIGAPKRVGRIFDSPSVPLARPDWIGRRLAVTPEPTAAELERIDKNMVEDFRSLMAGAAKRKKRSANDAVEITSKE